MILFSLKNCLLVTNKPMSCFWYSLAHKKCTFRVELVPLRRTLVLDCWGFEGVGMTALRYGFLKFEYKRSSFLSTFMCAFPCRIPSTIRYWARLNAIPHQYCFIRWFMSFFFLPDVLSYWFYKCQTCANSSDFFVFTRLARIIIFLLARLAPTPIFYLPDWTKILILQWPDSRQFWFFFYQTCANYYFLLARLGPILILQWPDMCHFWFFNCQTCGNSDFSLARATPNLNFHLPDWH